MPTYPLASQWSNTYHVKVKTVDPNAALDANGALVPIQEVQKRTNIHDPNLQMEL